MALLNFPMESSLRGKPCASTSCLNRAGGDLSRLRPNPLTGTTFAVSPLTASHSPLSSCRSPSAKVRSVPNFGLRKQVEIGSNTFQRCSTITGSRNPGWHWTVNAGVSATPFVLAASLGGSPGASGGSESTQQAGDTVELPLFPLPLVLFPGSILPLQIFEYRYRIMMHTLLQTDLRFGVVFTGKERGTASAVGCVGQIVRHERLPDDRFFIICKGEERFRVMDVVRTRPYLVGRVSWLEDRPSSGTPISAPRESEGGLVGGMEDQPVSDLDTLANEVASIMSNVIRLTRKVKGSQGGVSEKPGSAQDETAPLDLRKSSFPTPFSFWVASTFEGAPLEQQALLELVDTKERLERERETLRNTLNYLTAAVAVRDAFPSSSSDSSSS